MSLGAGYQDECTTFGIVYANSAKQTYSEGTKDRVQTVMLRLELRTLGAAGYTYNAGGAISGRSEPVTEAAGRRRPLVLTQGDPAGIGPELALKAWMCRADWMPSATPLEHPSC